MGVGVCIAFRAYLWQVFEGLSLTRRLGIKNMELDVDSISLVKKLEAGVSRDIEGYTLVK